MTIFNDKSLKNVSNAVSKVMEASMKEELKGDQHKIDANKNNKVDAHDFKLLRAGKKVAKEDVEQVEEGIEDKLEAARAKAKASGKTMKGPAKAEKSNVTKVAGKAYGGSAQKDEPEEDEDDTPKKASKKGSFKRRYNTRAGREAKAGIYKEQFSYLLDSYVNGGLKSLMEDLEVVEEEVDNETFTKEVEAQKEKNAGKGKKAEVAKASVQAVKNEEVEQIDEFSKDTYRNAMSAAADTDSERVGVLASRYGKSNMDKLKDRAKKYHGAKFAHSLDRVAKRAQYGGIHNEEVESVEERTLTEPEMKKREDVVKGMKKNLAGFKERYGSRAKEVMYAAATNVAKGEK